MNVEDQASAGVKQQPAKAETPQLDELLTHLYREFGTAAQPGAPLMGVTLSMTYIGRDPVVATMGASDAPHAHALEAAAAQVRMVLSNAQDPRMAALLDKALRLLAAAEHLKTGTFFESNTKH